MQERLLRTRALLGNDSILKITQSTVMIAGLGGVGGYALEALARYGVSKFILIDSDSFDKTNLNRQLLSTNENIGRLKTDAAEERLNLIDKDIQVIKYPIFLDKSNINEVLDNKPDIVIDAIDSVNSKCLLLAECIKRKIKVVSSMGAALRKDPTKIQVNDISKTFGCPLAKQVRTELKKTGITEGIQCIFSPEPRMESQDGTLGSLPTVVGCFGLILAQTAINQIV